MSNPSLPGKPVQIAYFVQDAAAAARAMSAALGAGPFFLVERIELAWGEHRGRDCRFVHSSAYGQWGDTMLELVQQDEEGPSPFRDLYPPGREGLHHVAVCVERLGDALDHCRRSGWPLASRAMTRSGVEFAFVDSARPLGHMLELYEPRQPLRDFYQMVREAAAGWDGGDPVRRLR